MDAVSDLLCHASIQQHVGGTFSEDDARRCSRQVCYRVSCLPIAGDQNGHQFPFGVERGLGHARESIRGGVIRLSKKLGECDHERCFSGVALDLPVAVNMVELSVAGQRTSDQSQPRLLPRGALRCGSLWAVSVSGAAFGCRIALVQIRSQLE